MGSGGLPLEAATHLLRGLLDLLPLVDGAVLCDNEPRRHRAVDGRKVLPQPVALCRHREFARAWPATQSAPGSAALPAHHPTAVPAATLMTHCALTTS